MKKSEMPMTHPQQQLIAELLAALKGHDAYMLAAGYEGPESDALHRNAAANWRTVRAAIAKAEAVLSAGAVPQQEPQERQDVRDRIKEAIESNLYCEWESLTEAQCSLDDLCDDILAAVPALPAPQEQDQ